MLGQPDHIFFRPENAIDINPHLLPTSPATVKRFGFASFVILTRGGGVWNDLTGTVLVYVNKAQNGD